MGATYPIIALIPAYPAAIGALLFGASWGMALMVLIGTGVGVALLLAGFRFFLPRSAHDAQAVTAP
ncbi:hypothetical protein [Frigidibacter sp. ROC022]|uniref:hypothetical protein n=1 Tax=Frigidibacter sp. ROC022 TaxID=2971796 RepID=UPI00215B5BC0|nr:hypothetical protein [Frigidibacter sp. ROC022]MCR8726784.1 hypothetical protein [Frigidibacter sp. ROC022]